MPVRAAGRPVEVAGNVGRALTDVAERIEPGTTVVCELSSFQLEDVHELACEVAVLLNLEPDHLDRHESFGAYRAAKLRIFERARVKVVPRGSGLEGIEFSADDELPAEPLIRGAHNRENAAAATAAARALGIPDDRIARALETFPGVPHRLEPVSATFHGRDLFAPVAAHLAAGAALGAAGEPIDPDDLVKLQLPTPYVEAERVYAHVVSTDTFGNVALDVTHDDGMAAGLRLGARVRVNGTPATYARTFEDVGPGELMLYEDAYRTLALAINRGSAQEFLDLGPNDEVQIEP